MRSLLFVPGDSTRKLEKGLGSEADALIIDLEDAVDHANKQQARATTSGFLREARQGGTTKPLFVRVNGLSSGLTDPDLAAIVGSRPNGVVLPKTVGGADVKVLAERLGHWEAQLGVPAGETKIIAIATENARGLFAIGTLAEGGRRLIAATWGGEDLSADIGAQTNRGDDGLYTDPYRLARSFTLLGAAAAGVDALDAVFTNYRDLAGLEQESRLAKRDGFVGKMAIHPAQVPIINAAFTPTVEAITYAQAVIDAFAAEPGMGVVGLEGEMLDFAHLRRAHRTLGRRGDSPPTASANLLSNNSLHII